MSRSESSQPAPPRAPRLAGVLLAVAVAAGFGFDTPEVAAQDGPPPQPELRVLRYAMVRDNLAYTHASAQEVMAGAETLCEQVSKDLQRGGRHARLEAVYTQNFMELRDGLAAGTIDCAFVSGIDYVRLREQLEVQPLGAATGDGDDGATRLALVVSARHGAVDSIGDLRGKTFARVGSATPGGYFYPQYLLHRGGHGVLAQFFGEIADVSKERSALYAVLVGKADVTCVSLRTVEVMLELNPGLARKFKVLSVSGALPNAVLVTRPGLEPDLRAELQEFIDTMTSRTEPEVQQVMIMLRLSGTRRLRDEDFEYTRELLDLVGRFEKRHVDPICGTRLADPDAAAHTEVAGELVSFCSESCRDRYQEHHDRTRPGAERPLRVTAIDPAIQFDRDPRELLAGVRRMLPETGVEWGVELVPSLAVAEARLRDGTLTTLRVTGPGYVRLREALGVVPVVRPETAAASYKAAVVVHESLGARTVADLTGRRIALPAAQRSEFQLFLRTLLRGVDAGEPETFFRAVLDCPSESSALRAVAVGDADAAIVKDTSLGALRETRPALGRALVAIQTSEILRSGPLCVRGDLPAAEVEAFKQEALRVYATPRGRAELEYLGLRSVVEARDSDYDGVRALIRSGEREAP